MICLECARPAQGGCSFGLYRGQKTARRLIEADINGADTS
jgi:hypothetical protein